MATLLYVAGIAWIICWIVTLISMFQKGSVLHGILGILCGLWAFIWGWMNTAKTGQKNVMLVWTICWILIAIAQGSMGFGQLPGG